MEDSSLVWEFDHVHGRQGYTILRYCISLIPQLNVQVDNITKNDAYRAQNINHRWLQYSLPDSLPRVFMGYDKIQPTSQLTNTLSLYTRTNHIRRYREEKEHFTQEHSQLID